MRLAVDSQWRRYKPGHTHTRHDSVRQCVSCSANVQPAWTEVIVVCYCVVLLYSSVFPDTGILIRQQYVTTENTSVSQYGIFTVNETRR